MAHARRSDTALDELRRRLPALLRAGRRALLLSGAWLVFSVPVVTWMAAAAALVHGIEHAGRPGGVRPLAAFWQGWRRHWRAALPLGIAALLLLAALVANLLFLTGQAGAAAFLLLVGTLVLMALWAISMLSLVPVLVLLPHLPRSQALRVGVLLGFRRPLATIGVVAAAVLIATGFGQVWAPLALLTGPGTWYLALRLAHRHLPVA